MIYGGGAVSTEHLTYKLLIQKGMCNLYCKYNMLE